MMNHPLMIALLLMQISASSPSPPNKGPIHGFPSSISFVHKSLISQRNTHTQTLSRPYARRNALLLVVTY